MTKKSNVGWFWRGGGVRAGGGGGGGGCAWAEARYQSNTIKMFHFFIIYMFRLLGPGHDDLQVVVITITDNWYTLLVRFSKFKV